MKKILLFILLSFLSLPPLKAQDTFDIIFSRNSSEDANCNYFNKYFKNTPKEIGYSIVKAEKDMRVGKYDDKDESVEFIIDTYENFNLSNYDYLSLAQFLSYYSNTDDATDLLDDKVRTITVDEDLLFYYLNLTITNKYNVASKNYRTMMLNAINMNPKRFCKLFNSSLNEGVTFQLLEDEYLRNTYCENCVRE